MRHPIRTVTTDDDIMRAQEKVRRLQQQLEMAQRSGGSAGGSARQSIASAIRSEGGANGSGNVNVGVRGGGVFGGEYHSDDENSSSKNSFGMGERNKSISGSSGGNVDTAVVVPKKAKSAKAQNVTFSIECLKE
ncbi:UNVERIFIED_CONTAM: hypothetical protein HDU68_002631 [Siphonaria sp. JEL0065]|nr:hypothetical protein HDU68_002631 [Siphonaria sp. JEL0065]